MVWMTLTPVFFWGGVVGCGGGLGMRQPTEARLLLFRSLPLARSGLLMSPSLTREESLLQQQEDDDYAVEAVEMVGRGCWEGVGGVGCQVQEGVG